MEPEPQFKISALAPGGNFISALGSDSATLVLLLKISLRKRVQHSILKAEIQSENSLFFRLQITVSEWNLNPLIFLWIEIICFSFVPKSNVVDPRIRIQLFISGQT